MWWKLQAICQTHVTCIIPLLLQEDLEGILSSAFPALLALSGVPRARKKQSFIRQH
jgi:hypothetical protein